MLDDLTKFQSFLQQVPKEAPKTREDVEDFIENWRHGTQEHYVQRKEYFVGQITDKAIGTQ